MVINTMKPAYTDMHTLFMFGVHTSEIRYMQSWLMDLPFLLCNVWSTIFISTYEETHKSIVFRNNHLKEVHFLLINITAQLYMLY